VRFTVAVNDKGDSVVVVERNIAPPLAKAVTMPIEVDGQLRGGIAIYLGVSAFKDSPISDELLKEIAHDIAWRINRQVP
jgi:hypothetical protein